MSQRGFTLLETLVALGLFAIVLASLTPLLITTIQANARASRITKATCLAQDKLEVLRNTPYAAITSGSDTVAEGGSTKAYARSWTVTAGPTATTKTVIMTVGWTDQRAGQVRLDTIVGD